MSDLFKIRASSGGILMVAPRSKTETISETTKTYIKEWLVSQIYGFDKQIKSKYLMKGTWLENEAIDKAIEWLDLKFVIKNEDTFEDDFFKGTPDFFLDNVVYDIKCSWDCFTFPIFEDKIPNKDYYYQLQIYMHLTGCKKACLTYVLLDTPEELLYEQKFTYEHLDKKYRIKTFEFDYDVEVIEHLKSAVILAREYILTLNK